MIGRLEYFYVIFLFILKDGQNVQIRQQCISNEVGCSKYMNMDTCVFMCVHEYIFTCRHISEIYMLCHDHASAILVRNLSSLPLLTDVWSYILVQYPSGILLHQN